MARPPFTCSIQLQEEVSKKLKFKLAKHLPSLVAQVDMLLEKQQYVPPLTCVIQIQEGVSEKLPIILLCQATPPLGNQGGHAHEGPAVGGHAHEGPAVGGHQ